MTSTVPVDDRPQLAPDGLDGSPLATATITPGDLAAALHDGGEVALLDVRDEADYATGHLLLSSTVPVDQLEARVASLAPRRSVRLVLIDGDGEAQGAAAQGAGRLVAAGYGDVRVLAGGTRAWAADGRELITGLNSLSKALGEFVERRYRTPRISVTELKARQDAGEDLVVIDTRPVPEFEHISIPGAASAPGAELLHRAYDAVPGPDTTLVVNCAGRTRAIIGAQALINAGFPNPVLSLENGTSAWLFEGFVPGHGSDRHVPAPTAPGLEAAVAAAGRIAERFGVPTIGTDELARFQAEADDRSLFLYDVRTPDEYAAGHLAGSRSAPGGQLVQATDTYVGTFRGRIVLVDDPDNVRATVTASWLIQLGFDHVYVLRDGLADRSNLETGPDVAPVVGSSGPIVEISPDELAELLAGGDTTVVDVTVQPKYFEGHPYIPGALAARRAALVDDPDVIPGGGTIVVSSPDGVIARFAATELAHVTHRPVRVLRGGTAAWVAAGQPFEDGTDQPALTPDSALAAHPDLETRKHAFAEYVAWGDVIVEQIERDGVLSFRTFD